MSPFGQVIPVTGLNYGFPGTVSELGDPLVVSKPVLGVTPDNIQFGQGVVVIPNASGGGDTVVSIFDYILATAQGGQGGTFTAAKFGGVARREVKTNLVFPQNPDVSVGGGYAPNSQCDFAVRGTVSVYIQNGTPASQGVVYIRKTYNPAFPNGVVGGFEAGGLSDTSTNCVALVNVVFKNGNMDANNVTEITMLERQAA
jgi:hypothetical protein